MLKLYIFTKGCKRFLAILQKLTVVFFSVSLDEFLCQQSSDYLLFFACDFRYFFFTFCFVSHFVCDGASDEICID